MTALDPTPGIFRGQRGSRLLVAGVVLAVSALVVLGAGLIGAALIDAEIARRSAERVTDTLELGDLAGIRFQLALGSFLPAVLIFAAVCVVIPGEMKRRGGWATRETTFWRGGSNAMIYRTLSVRIHAIWTAVASGFSLVLVAVPGITAEVLGWPGERDSISWSYLNITGVVVTAIACAFVGTLVKKYFWERAGRPDIETVGAGGSQRFWRWLTYRWRFDVWFAVIGGLGIGMSVFQAHLDSTDYWPTVLVVSVALFVLGVVGSANFWRSGEDLGTQESAS